MEAHDALVAEGLELLVALRAACTHLNVRIEVFEAYLGRVSRMRQAAQDHDQGSPPRSDHARDAYVPNVR